jgi:hypothetical protein
MREVDSSDEKKTNPSSGLIRLTHFYSGVAELLLVVASYSELVFLEVHIQLIITVLYMSLLIYSLLLRESFKWFLLLSWIICCADLGFLIFQLFNISLNIDWTTKKFRVVFSVVVLVFAGVCKVILDALLMYEQYELLHIPLSERLSLVKQKLRSITERMQLFIWLSIAYAVLISADLLTSRIQLWLGTTPLYSGLFLLPQLAMPVLLANLIFKVRNTVMVSLLLFALCVATETIIIWWVAGHRDAAGTVEGVLRLCFSTGRIFILAIEAHLLWKAKRPLILGFEHKRQ